MTNVERRLDKFSKVEVAAITDSFGARHLVQQPLVLDLDKPLRDQDGNMLLDDQGQPKMPDRKAMLDMHNATIDNEIISAEKREAEYLKMASALGHSERDFNAAPPAASVAVAVPQLAPAPDITECEHCK